MSKKCTTQHLPNNFIYGCDCREEAIREAFERILNEWHEPTDFPIVATIGNCILSDIGFQVLVKKDGTIKVKRTA